MKISEISIKRPIYVVVLFTVLTVLGIMGYRSLSAELMPKFTPPTINVQIVYPGASPTEVESSLTRKVEDALSSLEGIETMRSYSFEGMSMLFVSFQYGIDIDKAITDAQNKIDAKKMELPSGILSPTINKITVDDRSIITLYGTSDLEATEFFDLMDKRIIPEILRIRGVAKAVSVGGQEREIQVNLDMEKMRAFGLTPIQVQGVLRGANLDFPTGSLRNEETNTSIRLSGKFSGVDEIKNLVVFTLPATGTQIRMQDIAEITDIAKDAVQLARVDGKDAVLLNIFKQGDANAVEVSDMIRERLDQLETQFAGSNLRLEIAQDSTDFTRESISSVITDLLLAVLLVAFVMLLFLHNFRNAFIVMIVVPVSLVATFIGMQLFGFTLNLMSLLGLSVVIGVLVDDAIVVIENVHRHIEMGKNPFKASVDAMKEIGFTVISITMVLVLVFLPIALTNTLVSDILRQFCGAIIFSILFSLLAALTLVPLLTSRFGNVTELTGKNLFQKFLMWFERVIGRFGDSMSALLNWSLSHKKIVVGLVTLITVAILSLFPLGFIGFEFLPDVDRGEFIVQLEMPKDNSIEESNALVRRAEEWLLSQPEVAGTVTMVGMTSGDEQSSQGTPYLAEINVKLVPKDEREKETKLYITELKQPLTEYLVDAKVDIYSVAITGNVSDAAVQYVISGAEADSVRVFALKALEIMKSIPGTMQQKLSVESENPEVSVVVDRDKMSALGLTLDNVGLTMQLAFQGSNSIKYVEGDYEYDINIRADKNYREQFDDVGALTFINSRGEAIRLEQFADIELGTGPNRLERYNRNNSISISSQVLGVSSGTVSTAFLAEVEKINPNNTYTIEASGDTKSMSQSISVMTAALLLSILLVYLALVVLYNNWTDPLAVMFSIPLSILGAILALALTNTPLSIYGMLGLVMLIGLVAKNAILLVDFTNDALKEGKEMDESLVQAVKIRTRPILMTALSTIIGMLPVALTSGSGAELRNGLGWVIIGGMTLSTFLTLIVVPVVFKLLHRVSDRFKRMDEAEIDLLLNE